MYTLSIRKEERQEGGGLCSDTNMGILCQSVIITRSRATYTPSSTV